MRGRGGAGLAAGTDALARPVGSSLKAALRCAAFAFWVPPTPLLTPAPPRRLATSRACTRGYSSGERSKRCGGGSSGARRGSPDSCETRQGGDASQGHGESGCFFTGAGSRCCRPRARVVRGAGAGPQTSRVYPDRRAPLVALEAAEAWAACPCSLHAENAAETAPAAVSAFGAVWNLPPKEAAWAGRTAAWVGDAPKYHWQAVTAIVGACRATSAERVTNAAARFFAGEVGSSGGAHE